MALNYVCNLSLPRGASVTPSLDVSAASSEVQEETTQSGDWKDLSAFFNAVAFFFLLLFSFFLLLCLYFLLLRLTV